MVRRRPFFFSFPISARRHFTFVWRGDNTCASSEFISPFCARLPLFLALNKLSISCNAAHRIYRRKFNLRQTTSDPLSRLTLKNSINLTINRKSFSSSRSFYSLSSSPYFNFLIKLSPGFSYQ